MPGFMYFTMALYHPSSIEVLLMALVGAGGTRGWALLEASSDVAKKMESKDFFIE